MKRRQAIANIFLIISSAIVAAAGYGWYKLKKKQDLKILPSYRILIAELAEIIIPATDTPGAKDAKVEDFIIKIILDCEDTKEQNSFLKGLKDVQYYSLENFNRVFEKCLTKEKVAIMQHFENKEIGTNRIIRKIKTKIFGRSFFAQLKELTVIGYCTSELGAKNGLAYDYVPVTYEPCVPLLKSQKSWATK